jgi:hypothetical protein
MKLKPGRFYLTEAGSRWCCYFVNYDQNVAMCIEGATMRCELYFPDGTLKGRPQDTLVGEVMGGDRDLIRRLYERMAPDLDTHKETCSCAFCKLMGEAQAAIKP